MNSVGLNIFIAIVGISAGPGFINGLRTQGISLFLWGVVATTLPLILGMYVASISFAFMTPFYSAFSPGPAPQRLHSAWYAIEPKAKFPLLVTP